MRRDARPRVATLSCDQICASARPSALAPGLVDRLAELGEELPPGPIAAELDSGGLVSHAQVKRTLHVMTHEVMPALT